MAFVEDVVAELQPEFASALIFVPALVSHFGVEEVTLLLPSSYKVLTGTSREKLFIERCAGRGARDGLLKGVPVRVAKKVGRDVLAGAERGSEEALKVLCDTLRVLYV
ncbi:hypothetical protein [Ottowia sp.]|uniref:hypothetical protein n=1 Tax=Ottowia sp. TaxID=1898956 RepID=UPI0025D0B93E|nr:hypothetical protein [Ottowia sp.]MBK6616242.1 hypothetical protein [Ottowia sp.]